MGLVLAVTVAVGAVVLGAFVLLTPVPATMADGAADLVFGGHGAPPPRVPATTADVARCPWLERALDQQVSPDSLAADVLRRMSVGEKLGEIVLVHAGAYENINAGVPRLCIPALTLQDGPQGLAYGDLGVTQLPSPIGIAATFDTGVAETYGQVSDPKRPARASTSSKDRRSTSTGCPERALVRGVRRGPRWCRPWGWPTPKGSSPPGPWPWPSTSPSTTKRPTAASSTSMYPNGPPGALPPTLRGRRDPAHVATAMCAYPQLNGSYQCQDPVLLGQLEPVGVHRVGPFRPGVGPRPGDRP